MHLYHIDVVKASADAKRLRDALLTLEVGQGFLVTEDVLTAFHEAITLETEIPGWKHGRLKSAYNSNVVFFRAA